MSLKLIPRPLRRWLGLIERDAEKLHPCRGAFDLADALDDLNRVAAHRPSLTITHAAHLDRAARVLAVDAPTEDDLHDAAYELRLANAGILLDLKVGGRPCRSIPMNPAWLLNSPAVDLARAADEFRLPNGSLDPVRLAVLADGLEEGGCTNREILDHLRGPGLHVRQCWVIDLVLAKE